MNKELEALDKFIKDYLDLCEKLCTNKQEKMLLDSNSPYNVLKKYLEAIDNANPSETLECLEEWYGFLMADNDTIYSNGNENEIEYNRRKETIYNQYNTIKQALTTKSKKELVFDEFNKYITNLYKHRNDYEKKTLLDYEIDNAVIRASTIEEIYNKFKEVMRDE